MLYIHNPPYSPDPEPQDREIIAPPSVEPRVIHVQAPDCPMRGFEMPRESRRAVIALWAWRIAVLLLLILLAARSAHAQQSDVTIQAVRDASGNRVAVGDSVNTALRVAIVSGGGSGGTASTFGAAFPGVGTAVGFKDSAGVNMQPGNLDASGNIKVNCASGCTGAADTTASGALGALNAAVSIAMAGVNSVGFTLPANNLVGTLVCEASSDGATTWTATNVRQEGAVNNFWQPNFAVSSTAGSFGCQVPGGASHIRVRVSAYTSGTVTASVRATQQPELVGAINGVAGSIVPQYVQIVGGSDGTNLRAISTDTSGRQNVNINGAVTVQQATAANLKVDLSGTAANATAIKVDGSAVTQPISAASLPLPTGAATAAKQPALGTAGAASADVITIQGIASMTAVKVDGSGVTQPVSGTITANQGGTWTMQPGNTANTTPWLTTINQGGNSATVSAGGALKVDNSAVTQPVSGTVTANAGTGTFTNQQSNVQTDYDTGAGTQNMTMFGVALPASGGAVAGGTATNPLRTDPTGTTTQPVSGTVTANAGTGTFNIQANASVNVAQFGGSAAVTGTGASGAGIPRVTISNDSSLAANQSVNVNQVNGAALVADNGTNAGGKIPVHTAIAASSYPAAALTAGNENPQRVGLDGLTWTAQLPSLYPASYAASATVASAASATDIAVLPGNASKTVLVTRVSVSCTQTTAGIITLNIIKRSTADTAGTSAGMTVVPDDSANAAGVSAPLTYTANPTLGTAVGNVDTALIGCMATGTASPNDIYVLNRQQKPIVLRGTAQQLAVNLNGATVTGGSFAVTFNYIETTTP